MRGSGGSLRVRGGSPVRGMLSRADMRRPGGSMRGSSRSSSGTLAGAQALRSGFAGRPGSCFASAIGCTGFDPGGASSSLSTSAITSRKPFSTAAAASSERSRLRMRSSSSVKEPPGLSPGFASGLLSGIEGRGVLGALGAD